MDLHAIIPIKLLKNLLMEEWLLKHHRNDQIDKLTGNNINQRKIFGDCLIDLDVNTSGDIIITNNEVKTYLNSWRWENAKLIISTSLNKSSLNTKILDSKLRCVSKNLGTTIYTEKVDNEDNEYILKNKFVIKTKDKQDNNLFHKGLWEFYVDYNLESEIISHKITVIDNNFTNKNFSTHRYTPIIVSEGLGLNVSLIWSIADKTSRRREAIERYIYPLMRFLPLNKKRIIFESYWHKKYNCNPRYLYEYIDQNYPEYECIWVFFDESIKIKGNGKKTRFKSLKYFYYMATAKYFVNNVNFPNFYKKRRNTIEIQTMHGTPLKKIGLDAPEEITSQLKIGINSSKDVKGGIT